MSPLTFTPYHRSHTLAEQLRKNIEEKQFKLGDGRTINVTCSSGFANLPFSSLHPDAISWEQVVNIADIGLYAAKRSSRNAWVGICSTENTSPDNLSQRIQQDIETLLKNRELKTQSAVQNSKLVWEKL